MNESACKAVDPAAVTDGQMELLNRYTRRALDREEVYVFSVILCDNEIDRDGERFPTEALHTLAGLFPGKTGVLDHRPTSENQSARVFDTAVEQTGEINSLGEPYAHLKAWAYMLRCEKNADLIREIDGGIKKEVSVSCQVARVLCSACGADQRTGGCGHRKGEQVDGLPCHHLLADPTDAFEWSFVAVPAQRRAGVVKRTGGGQVDAATLAVDKAAFHRLERLAALGEQYEHSLRERVVRLGLLGCDALHAPALREIAGRLDAPQLEALEKGFASLAARRYPLEPQLARVEGDDPGEERAYRI